MAFVGGTFGGNQHEILRVALSRWPYNKKGSKLAHSLHLNTTQQKALDKSKHCALRYHRLQNHRLHRLLRFINPPVSGVVLKQEDTQIWREALICTHAVEECPALFRDGFKGRSYVPLSELSQDLGQGLHGFSHHTAARLSLQGAQALLQQEFSILLHLEEFQSLSCTPHFLEECAHKALKPLTPEPVPV